MEGTVEEVEMGANVYSKVWHNCSTCDFWSGARRLHTPDSVQVDSSAVGQCGGFWKGSRKYGNTKCTEWKAWAKLSAGPGQKDIGIDI